METSQDTTGSLDPQAVALTQAIRQQESNNNPNLRGASGEYGAYQWLPETWASESKAAGVNKPLEQSTLEDQNKVAYHQIKQWKDAGYNPAQIASLWNSGKPEWAGNVGVNKEGVAYNTPEYVNKVYGYYQQYKQKIGVSPTQMDVSQTIPSPSLGKELGQRFQAGGTAAAQALTGGGELMQGQIGKGAEDVVSGALQTAGAAAGAVGDIAQKGLEMIPGVKAAEGAVGTALGELANTTIGKQITGDVSNFIQAHPEASANIGAVANIASVIPMFKAAGLAVSAGRDALGAAMKDSLTKAAGNEIEGVAGRTLGGRALLSKAEARGIDPIGSILKGGALPEVVQDSAGTPHYSTANAFEAMNTQPEEDALQYALKSAPMTEGGQASIEQSRKNALKAVAQQFENRTDYDQAIKETNAIFDSYKNRFGDKVFLDKINQLKRGVRESVNFNSPKLQSDIHYIIGQSLMDDVEMGAKKLGIQGVPELNKAMAEKIEAKKLLKLMDGRPVKVTKWGKWARRVKMGTASAVGGLIGGTPGAIVGGILESGAAQPSTALTRLSRSGGLLQKAKSLAKTAPLGLLRTGAPQEQ